MKRKSGSNGSKAFALNLKRFEIAALVVLGLLFAYPLFTSALSFSSASSSPAAQTIRAEIATLLEKVEQLKQQLKQLQQGSTGTSTPERVKPKRICPLIARALLSGTHGDDVADLQEFLSEEGYFDRNNISAYFGPLTRSALQKWQAAQGIISSGDAATTGWGVAGPRTREFILKRCGGFREDKLFSVPPVFGTSTWPGIIKKGPGQSLQNVCPVVSAPPSGSCDGTWRLDWKSTGGGMKCLAWKCHSDDDDDDEDEEENENDDDSDDDDDSDEDGDDDTATSTGSN